jgi:hypothetical protein
MKARDVESIYSTLQKRHSDLKQGWGFVHLIDVLGLEGSSEFRLGEKLVLRRATDDETTTIRELISLTEPHDRLSPNFNPYEQREVSKAELSLRMQRNLAVDELLFQSLEPEDWRYYVCKYECEDLAEKFMDAIRLTKRPIQVGVGVDRSAGGDLGISHWKRPPEDWRTRRPRIEKYSHLNEGDYLDLVSVMGKLASLSNRSIAKRLDDAFVLLGQLEKVPLESHLRLLGLMAILELIVTHKPDPKDPTDSLTRQVTHKMRLVGNRNLIHDIPYDVFTYPPKPKNDTAPYARNEKADKAWKKLYSLRSDIAHGSTPDFKKELALLGSMSSAIEFLETTLRSVLRLSIEEPDLVDDLNAC